MRRWITFMLFIALSAKGYSQANTDSLIKALVNTAYKEIVDPKAKFYYLHEKGESLNAEDWDIYELKNEKELLADVPLAELMAVTKTDTASIDWKNYNLANARCLKKPLYKYSYSYKISNIVSHNTPDYVINKLMDSGIIPIIPTKKNMSKKQLAIAQKKGEELYENYIPLEGKQFYSFSKPVFSKNLDYALIGLNRSDQGFVCIFKLVDGKWVRIFSFARWVV
jgi:hypothetical protein